MDKEKMAQEVFQEVSKLAPAISAGILDRREYVDDENPSDEKQLEADVWANEILKEKITEINGVGEFASEEEEKITECGKGVSVTIDPLDGSSNIPTNNIVGTIVGIYDEKLPCSGRNLISAFYIVYGPLTTAVKADGEGVDEFVIESKDDGVEINLVKDGIELPEAQIYGFGGNKNWNENFREFENGISRELKLRYGGAFVGDINQVLEYGGIFAYPSRTDAPQGKLRLLFECNPIAFIVASAGGASSDTDKSILDVEVEEIHQRTPFFAGNKELIDRAEEEL